MELNSYIAILAPPKHKNQPTAALVAVELNSYITILAPPKHKNQPTAVELKVFFFFYLHCYSAQLSMVVHCS